MNDGKELATASKHEIGEIITEKLIIDYMTSFGIASKLDDNAILATKGAWGADKFAAFFK